MSANLQAGAAFILNSGTSGTFTNCNFTTNNATVSLEEEYADGSSESGCMTVRLYPPCTLLTDLLLLPLLVYYGYLYDRLS